MRLVGTILLSFILGGSLSAADSMFAITGTEIPSTLLQQNYGRVPKGISGYDLNICNVSESKQSIVSSAIYQALAQPYPNLQPIGREIMLAAILRNQNRSKTALITMMLNSVTGVLSVLSTSKASPPAGLVGGAALGTLAAQQLLTNFKPALSSDQLEKFEDQVLQPALVLDSGSCVERTIFATGISPSLKPNALTFHIR